MLFSFGWLIAFPLLSPDTRTLAISGSRNGVRQFGPCLHLSVYPGNGGIRPLCVGCLAFRCDSQLAISSAMMLKQRGEFQWLPFAVCKRKLLAGLVEFLLRIPLSLFWKKGVRPRASLPRGLSCKNSLWLSLNWCCLGSAKWSFALSVPITFQETSRHSWAFVWLKLAPSPCGANFRSQTETSPDEYFPIWRKVARNLRDSRLNGVVGRRWNHCFFVEF